MLELELSDSDPEELLESDDLDPFRSFDGGGLRDRSSLSKEVAGTLTGDDW